ncbi:hypothetical protein PUR71_00530, partial [Streptomyces sp. SP17BM10]|uniref:hypothetical protein n=1 Tax=Streptomyces sp. SP17BM10 TaxID=3002530 RepID=UPI002E75FC10
MCSTLLTPAWASHELRTPLTLLILGTAVIRYPTDLVDFRGFVMLNKDHYPLVAAVLLPAI